MCHLVQDTNEDVPSQRYPLPIREEKSRIQLKNEEEEIVQRRVPGRRQVRQQQLYNSQQSLWDNANAIMDKQRISSARYKSSWIHHK